MSECGVFALTARPNTRPHANSPASYEHCRALHDRSQAGNQGFVNSTACSIARLPGIVDLLERSIGWSNTLLLQQRGIARSKAPSAGPSADSRASGDSSRIPPRSFVHRTPSFAPPSGSFRECLGISRRPFTRCLRRIGPFAATGKRLPRPKDASLAFEGS